MTFTSVSVTGNSSTEEIDFVYSNVRTRVPISELVIAGGLMERWEYGETGEAPYRHRIEENHARWGQMFMENIILS